MSEKDNQLIKAREHWNNGNGLEAGRLIFEQLSLQARPEWASRILKLVVERSGIRTPALDQVLFAAERQACWKRGHDLFAALRASTLQLDALRRERGLSDEEELANSVLSLAELVAKVIYNASNPIDEFDEDSGWWIAASLRGFVDQVWHDERFAKAAWLALSSDE